MDSFILGFGVGLFAHYLGVTAVSASILGIVIWLISGVLELAYVVAYLKTKTNLSTDADVFGIKSE